MARKILNILNKNIIPLVMLLVTVLSTILGIFTDSVNTYADSNDRIKTYIQLAAGQQDNNDMANMDLSAAQLRFLGVYVSNFFVPFGTEIGAAADVDETDNLMSQIAESLTTSLSFSDIYAQAFAEELMGLSRASATDLIFAASSEYQTDYYIPEKYTLEANYYNFLGSMIGVGSDMLSRFDGKNEGESGSGMISSGDSGNINEIEAYRDDWTYGYWGYMSGNDFVPVADFKLRRNDGMTAFQYAFINCLKSSDFEEGWGWSIFDLTSDEVGDGSISDNLNSSEKLDLSIFGMRVKVDCFGNIIICGLQHQIIGVPGCVNPYTWVIVDADGKDMLPAGEAYNGINVPSMSIADLGTGIYDDNGMLTSLFTSVSQSSLNTSGSGSMSANSTYTATILDRNSQYIQDIVSALNGSGGHETLMYALLRDTEGAINFMFSYAAGIPGAGQFTTSISSDGIKVSATVEMWSKVNPDVFDSDYSIPNDNAGNQFESYVDYIFHGDTGLAIFDGVADFVLDIFPVGIQNQSEQEDFRTNVANTVSHCKDTMSASNDQSTNPDDGSSSVTIKNMSVRLGSAPFITGGGYDLRVYKGTTETDLSGAVFPLLGAAQSLFDIFDATDDVALVQEIVEEYKSVYPNDYGPYHSEWFEGNTDQYSHIDFKADLPISMSNIYLLDAMVVIDNIGVFESGDYHTFNVLNYVNSDGTTINNSDGLGWEYGSDNTFAAGYSDAASGKMSSSVDISENTIVSLYSTYVMASLYNNTAEDKQNTIGKLGFRMNTEGLPDIPDEPLELSDELRDDLLETTLKSFLYYLLHPTEGLAYFRELITNKLNNFLVGWHNDMLGTNGVGATTGTTLYKSNYGYVTTPDLSEIEWTSSLVDFYNSAIPFLIIVMLIAMILSFITGALSLQRAIFGLLIFSVFLMLPTNLINQVVGYSNNISESLYGNKFTYWALIQQESYVNAIDEAASSDNYTNYLQTLYSQNNAVYSNQGSESITLKWQSPKKMTSLMISSDDSMYESLTGEGQAMLNSFITNKLSGESYLDNLDSVYLYRSYIDVSNFSRYIYQGISEGKRSSNTSLNSATTSNWDEDMKNQISTIREEFTEDRNLGYTNKNHGSSELSSGIKLTVPLSSSIVNDAFADIGSVSDMSIDDFIGINQNLFEFGIPAFTGGSDESFESIIKTNAGIVANSEEDRELSGEMQRYSEQDYVGLAGYSLYSENVFYYFSWGLYDLGLQTSSNAKNGYKELLLGDNNTGFFYNVDGNGELKDFMDMKSLFTYVIPYLRLGNQLVREWDDVYGLFIYDGVPTEEGHWDDEAIKNSEEMSQRYWHNLNVARLYGIYTPWVDIMYDCSYAGSETISAMGEEFVVQDPLDPASYPEERPMIFSESEMADYGLSRADLTFVEKKILDCNRGMEERMYELLNYYNFSDATLNTAAAMNCAFEFNSTFSENGILSNNHIIYPQSFELADFSYDAFLRFILSSTTGETMNTKDDFYQNIVDNSSTTTVIVMLILDILSMYVLPGFKIFFIVALFLSSILIVISIAFRVHKENKYFKCVFTGMILPMVKFMVISIVFSWVISLFMGNGNTAVTGSLTPTIQMGEPVSVMLVMLVADIVVMILYFIVIRGVVRDIINNAKASYGFIAGVIGGIGASIASAFSKGKSESSGGYANSDVESESASSMADINNSNGKGEEINISVGGETQGYSSGVSGGGGSQMLDSSLEPRQDALSNQEMQANAIEDDDETVERKAKDLNSKIDNGLKNVDSGGNNEVSKSEKYDKSEEKRKHNKEERREKERNEDKMKLAKHFIE